MYLRLTRSLSINLIKQFIYLVALIFITAPFYSNANSLDKELNKIYSKAPKVCTFYVSSGYRSKEHNKKVGGARNSFHLYNRARDIVTNCRTYLKKKALLRGLSVIIYKKHLHIDNRSKQICLIKSGKNYLACK